MNRQTAVGLRICMVLALSPWASSAAADSVLSPELHQVRRASGGENPGAFFDGSLQAAPLADLAVDAGSGGAVHAPLHHPVESVPKKSQSMGIDFDLDVEDPDALLKLMAPKLIFA